MLPLQAPVSSCCIFLCCHRTVTDVQISMLGLAIAVVAVLSSALQQIMCGTLQRKHLVSSHQLLSNTAHIQVSSGVLALPPTHHRTRPTCAAASSSMITLQPLKVFWTPSCWATS